MNSRLILPNILRFIFVVLIQVLILNQLPLHRFISPYIYPLFILLLPFRTPQWLMLVLGFSIGTIIDLFTHTPGLNAAATTLLAFIRNYIIELYSPRNMVSNIPFPSLQYLGFKFFLSYILTCIFIHLFVLFFLDSFGSISIFEILLRVLLSTLFSAILILLYEYLFISQKEK